MYTSKKMEADIRKAHVILRETDTTIPSDTLRFMLDASLEKLKNIYPNGLSEKKPPLIARHMVVEFEGKILTMTSVWSNKELLTSGFNPIKFYDSKKLASEDLDFWKDVHAKGDINSQKLYEHDCSSCVFLGNYLAHDLYFHPSSENFKTATVIGRFGKEADYMSGLEFSKNKDSNPVLFEAARRAIDKKLLTEDYK